MSVRKRRRAPRLIVFAVLCALSSALSVAAASAAGPFATPRAPDGVPAGYVSAPPVVASFPSKPADGGPQFSDARVHLGARAGFADGVSLGALKPCSTATMTVLINARALPRAQRKGNLVLNAWFDWNRDGNWNGAGCGVAEWEVQNLHVPLASVPRSGLLALPVVFRTGDQVREFWYRLTLSVGHDLNSYTGAAPGPLGLGESEDYHYDALPSTGAAGFAKTARKHGRKGHRALAAALAGAAQAAGGEGVSCTQNPAVVNENHQTVVKLNIHPPGLPKPDFQGTLLSANDRVNGPRYQKGDDYRAFLHIAASQKGAVRGQVIVDSIVFKSADDSHGGPHLQDDGFDRAGLQSVAFNFSFSRLGGVQYLTCTVNVIHEHLAKPVPAPVPKPPPPPPAPQTPIVPVTPSVSVLGSFSTTPQVTAAAVAKNGDVLRGQAGPTTGKVTVTATDAHGNVDTAVGTSGVATLDTGQSTAAARVSSILVSRAGNVYVEATAGPTIGGTTWTFGLTSGLSPLAGFGSGGKVTESGSAFGAKLGAGDTIVSATQPSGNEVYVTQLDPLTGISVKSGTDPVPSNTILSNFELGRSGVGVFGGTQGNGKGTASTPYVLRTDMNFQNPVGAFITGLGQYGAVIDTGYVAGYDAEWAAVDVVNGASTLAYAVIFDPVTFTVRSSFPLPIISGFDSSTSAIAPAPGNVEAIAVTYFNAAMGTGFGELLFLNVDHSQAYNPLKILAPPGPDVGTSFLNADPLTGELLAGANAFSGEVFIQSGLTLLSPD